MKKMLFVFALCLMAACKGEKSPAGVNTAEELAAFVKETYTDVFAAYAEANSQGTVPDISVFDKKYLTRSLQDSLNSEEFIDADYWLQAQDFSTPVFDIVDSRATDENSGYVDIAIKVFGRDSESVQDCRVMVRKEDGQWKIGGFQSW